MTDLSLYRVDLDTERPNPSDPTKVLRGDPPRTAFTKYNDMLTALHGVLRHVGNVSPANPVAGMQWADPVTEPPTEYVRNNANTAWILLSGPDVNRPTKQGVFALAELPDPTDWQYHSIVVSDAAGGPKLCVSTGSAWNLVNTTTLVS